MNNSFDAAAHLYDKTFTNSVIGKLQRQYVYAHLSEILKKNPPKNILEINCGTGEDALWLARQGFKVTATDISEKMIAVAESKKKTGSLHFKISGINQLPDHFSSEKFDLIFSNFGGLNCLSKTELGKFFQNAGNLLTPNGRLILVIMPKNTLWEQLYFLVKGQFKTIFRRKKPFAIADVNGEKITTYYHNPKETVTLAHHYFDVRQLNPIGFFVPPSYLEPFLENKKNLAAFMNRLEKSISGISFLSKYADHYFIAFQKK